MLFVAWLSALSLLSTAGSSGAAAQYRFDNWTTNNGLPQNSIRSIIQTRDGYLWMTTFDGLVRFDGVRFTVFEKSNTKGLRTNRFTALYEDKDGTLWAGTGDGTLTIYRDGAFTSYSTEGLEPNSTVYGFSEDLKGELLIEIGAGRFYMRDGKFIPAPPEYQAHDMRLFLAPSGSQWTISRSGATQVIGENVNHYPIKLSFADGVWPYEDSRGDLWLGDRSGLFRLRDGQVRRYLEKDGTPHTLMRPQCEDDEGGIWFATGPAHVPGIGLARFRDGQFTVHGKGSGLSNLTVSCIFKDREGTIWIGTSRGLYSLTKQFIARYSRENGLLSREVYPILQTRDGDIWVGSTRGLSRFRNGRFENTPLPPSHNIVQALSEDRAGDLWIGIVGGLLRYKSGKLKDLSSLVKGATVCTILTDRFGNVWVGCERGLFKFEGERVTAHYTMRDGLEADDVTVIHEDRNGELWIGTSGSLAHFKDGRFIIYSMADGVARNHIWCIHEDDVGAFWIGTYDDGLIRFRDGRFFHYGMENGLFNNGVFQILEDRRGYFWISCNRGIYRVSRKELNDFAEGRIARINSIAYGNPDGMPDIECNGGRLPAGIIARDGRFWFPTQNGVAVVDPEHIRLNPHAPPVLIESVTLERASVDFQRGVTIHAGQRDVEISYTGLSYIKSEQIKFKYKLEGLDADWIDAGTRRVAYFPYLPPGSYRFRVIAANSDGVWNHGGADLLVTVQAPFWLRAWFWSICAGAVAVIAILIVRSRISHLRRKHAERDAFSRQLLQSQESERRRIAAELHDSLAQNLLIVKNWALVGLTSLEEDNPAREHLNEISETTSLALDDVRQIAHNLRPYQLERLGLTNTIEHMVNQIRNASDIQFTAEIDNIDGMLSNESEINLYRVVQECVNNVVKHSAAANAWLSMKRTAGGVDITCKDDGRGFDVEAISRHSGMGLASIAERVRMLGGRYDLDTAPGKGATIHVNIEQERKRADGKGTANSKRDSHTDR